MSKFKESVIKIVKAIPFGKVASYGQVALMVGIPRAAIQVGWVLNKSDSQDNIPWWRVVNNAGRLSIKGSTYTPQDQKDLLLQENIQFNNSFNFDIEKYRWRPSVETMQKLQLSDNAIQDILVKHLV